MVLRLLWLGRCELLILLALGIAAETALALEVYGLNLLNGFLQGGCVAFWIH